MRTWSSSKKREVGGATTNGVRLGSECEVRGSHAGVLAHRAASRQAFPANQSVIFAESESAFFASRESWISAFDLADASAAHQELAPAFCSNFDGHSFLQLKGNGGELPLRLQAECRRNRNAETIGCLLEN